MLAEDDVLSYLMRALARDATIRDAFPTIAKEPKMKSIELSGGGDQDSILEVDIDGLGKFHIDAYKVRE